ncbi:hypothetical protein BC829DRAFT_214280 [Chytridium lagenaria]|nr:hypothetical protein BC829DRAFT_214280 [Chytridium lagenaria]
MSGVWIRMHIHNTPKEAWTTGRGELRNQVTMQERLKTVEALLTGLMHQGVNVNTSALLGSSLKAELSMSPDMEDEDGSEGSEEDDEEQTHQPVMSRQPPVRSKSGDNSLALVRGSRGQASAERLASTTQGDGRPQESVATSNGNFFLEEESFSGFRGIALSLQRKLRHNVHRPPHRNGGGNGGSSDDDGRNVPGSNQLKEIGDDADVEDALLLRMT